ERRLGLHEIEALALALGLENTALDLGKLEHRSLAAVDEPQLVLGPQRPGHHLFERRDGAGRIELELEAAARCRIDTERHRTALVAIGIGDLPGGTDEVLGKITGWWRTLRARRGGRQRQRRKRHDPPKPDDHPHGEMLARREWRRHGDSLSPLCAAVRPPWRLRHRGE